MSDEIPAALLARHPELPGVERALAAHRAGEPVIVDCTVCGKPLSLVHIEETGVTVITCPTGCTDYRSRARPPGG
jgi:hypothetical protein